MREAEADFQTTVIAFARLRGWKVAHVRPARLEDGSWRTAYEGDDGLPDLILARNGVVLLAELKSDTGRKPSASQQAWLDAAGENGFCWRPRDWSTVMRVLT